MFVFPLDDSGRAGSMGCRLEAEVMIGLACATRNAGVCKERAPAKERCDRRVWRCRSCSLGRVTMSKGWMVGQGSRSATELSLVGNTRFTLWRCVDAKGGKLCWKSV